MLKSQDKFKIVLESNKVEKGWFLLQNEFPEQLSDCKEFLRTSPEDRMKAVGKLKKLKGDLEGILQYDITKNDVRVWYIVDKKNRTVIIKYAGHHPE